MLDRIIVRKQTTDQVLESGEWGPLLLELLYGSLRHYFSLCQAVDRALHTPLRVKDHDLKCLMIVGLYQLHHTRIPAHAALHETVEAVRPLGKPWAKGLINAVLRNATTPIESFEHPAWIERALRQAYGGLAPAIMLANNERAPMALRVNLSRISPDGFRELLNQAGLEFRAPLPTQSGAHGWGPETLFLRQPIPASRLPGYADGLISIQDAGAQLVPSLLNPETTAGRSDSSAAGHQRLLDACAAPGGKLFHLLERFPAFEAVALDSSRERLATLETEARRLGHTGFRAIVGDATALDWWDGGGFDYVLVDAPCSGSGTLRRHPDIKLLKQAADLPRYAELQGRLLATLWPTLQVGGKLIYSTCSIFPAENDDVMRLFLSSLRDAETVELLLPTGRATEFGWQLLPTDADTDGFYFAALKKKST